MTPEIEKAAMELEDLLGITNLRGSRFVRDFLAKIIAQERAKVWEEAADYIRRVRSGNNADSRLFNASSEFELRARAQGGRR